jgi:NADH dehydrogenase
MLLLIRKGGIKMKDHRNKLNVLILGAGFGGICTAKYLLKLTKKISNVKITLIDRNTYHFFTPLLHEVATASIHSDHIKRPLRMLLNEENVEFHQGEIKRVDLKNQSVEICTNCTNCDTPPKYDHYTYINKADFISDRKQTFRYDYLVLAMGSDPNFFGVTGADKYSYTLSSIKTSEEIKARTLECFELANQTNNLQLKKELLTFVVIGAGATGTEYVVELHDLCKNVLAEEFEFVKFDRDCRIILIDAMDQILPNMDPYLVKYAMKHLQENKIEIMTSTKVTKISDCTIELNGEISIPTHSVLWAAGVKANNVAADLPLNKDSIGRIKVNSFLQATDKPEIFALGDNACFMPEEGERPLMQTAQVAVQESRIVAMNIVKHFNGTKLHHFKYVFLGSTVSLGAKKGVANLVGKFELKGFAAWFSWKLTYLRHLLVIEKLSRALWDWSFDLLYNRQMARFKLH